jgi:hypothetical protein
MDPAGGAELTASGEIGQGFVGAGLALTSDGSSALIGAPGNNGSAGAAWAITRSDTRWTQVEQLAPTEVVGKAMFGSSAALPSAGTTTVLGGFEENSIRIRNTVARRPRPMATHTSGRTIEARAHMPRYGKTTLAICPRLQRASTSR